MFPKNDCYEKAFSKPLSFCVASPFKNCMDIMLFMLIHTVTEVFSMASHENTLNRITFYAKSLSLFFLIFTKTQANPTGYFASMHTTIMACAEKEAFHNV